MADVPGITTVVAFDAQYFEQFRVTWPTWRALKPEVTEWPLLLMVDGRRGAGVSRAMIRDVIGAKANVRIVWWLWPYNDWSLSQRERMLTALVAAAQYVETPYYFKIDTDVVATRAGEWLAPWWFEHNPVLVSPAWGYSRPADVIDRLDIWGDKCPDMADFGRLGITAPPGSTRVRHRRIAGFAMFGRTDWTREMWRLAQGRLPVPSQDTYLWYCAERRREFYRRVRMRELGWEYATRAWLAEAAA